MRFFRSQMRKLSRIRDFPTLIQFANECSSLYFRDGFQVVYAIHYEAGGQVHIHFAVSTINFRTGAKWHSSMVDLSGRQECFNAILPKNIWMKMFGIQCLCGKSKE